MSCPYFYPTQPRARASTTHDAMLPLGDWWAGVCHAIPDRPAPPDDAALRPLCNLGYARDVCARFPAGDGPDAVRFTICRDDGVSIGVSYVLERDYHPFAQGRLQYSETTRAFAEPPGGEILERQARAYMESYRRLKSQR